MGFIRFILWTATSVGFGVGLATVDLGGKTPLEHVARLWKEERPQLERAGHAAAEEVRRKVAGKDMAGPKEQHTASDKNAIDEIIAKRQQRP